MEESSDRTSSVMSSGMTNKMNSDSGYGSNKSNSNKSNNSQSQRSSGSSKSHQSSLSSGSCGFLSHLNAPAPNADQHEQPTPGSQGPAGATGKTEKRRKKKTKVKSASITNVADLIQRLASVEEGKKTTAVADKANNVGGQNKAFPSTDISQECLPDARFPPPPADSKTLQMAALSHVLSCFKNVREQDLDLTDDSDNDKMSSSSVWSEKFEAMKEELDITTENCFGAVVAMADGLVVHVTEDIANILGYPKDMWTGRSFMDLVHPKDKISFASQFTTAGGVNFPAKETNNQASKGSTQDSESYYCRLRQYRGLKTTGFGITDKPVLFFPFRLSLKFKEVEGIPGPKSKSKAPQKTQVEAENEKNEKKEKHENAENKKAGVYLFIGAHRIPSAYQFPEEVPSNPEKFVTRHSAACQFGHIDASSVSYLGHLPQDVIGQSVLDYYHPDDMVLLRDIYEAVMTERGKPFKSKPYRFRSYNGTFATLETDWSCFINPWSWKLEFVIGQHKVVKGPSNPNVFMPPKPPDPVRADNGTIDAKRIQEQIKQRLTETISKKVSDPLRLRVSRRKKDLTVLLETLLDQLGTNDSSEGQSDSAGSAFSVMERDSAMLGEISPHHDDHSGSNQSSETPPSYNQLNYRENIERFFLSHPKTTRESDESGSGDAAKHDVDDLPLGSTEDEDSKGSPNGSSASVNRQSGNNSTGENNESYEAMAQDEEDRPCSLTEHTLYRHNENMEKSLIKRHREIRGKNTSLPSSHKNCRMRLNDPINGRSRTLDYHNRSFFKGDKHNNLKRTGNLAGWTSTTSSRKAHKQPHMDVPAPAPSYPDILAREPIVTNPALWPPYSVGSTDVTTTTTVAAYTPAVAATMSGLASIPAPGPVDVPMQSLLNPPQHARPFMCFPSQPQFVQTPGVSYTLPGTANIMYQPLAAPSYAQPVSVYGPGQTVLIAPGGTPLVGPMFSQASQLLPTVPGAIQSLNMNVTGASGGYRSSNIRAGAMQPGLVRPQPIPVHLNPAVLRQGVAPRGLGLNQNQNLRIPTSSSSLSNSNIYPISTSSSSCISALSPLNLPPPPTTPAVRYNLNKVPHKPVITRNKNKEQSSSNNEDSSSSSPELSNFNNKKLPNRLVEVKKATADFSSSDGFGDSSSGSMFSLLKTGRSSDESFSPNGSGEGKNSPDRYQSNGFDGDQEMLWENHFNRNEPDMYEELRNRSKLLKKPPWLQNVDMTPELSMRYQIADGDMSEILQRDLNKLRIIANQPTLVDEQLATLYTELQADGNDPNLNLEEGNCRLSSSFSSSNSDDDSEESEKKAGQIRDKREISRADYEKIVQVYEENAPFPKRIFGI